MQFSIPFWYPENDFDLSFCSQVYLDSGALTYSRDVCINFSKEDTKRYILRGISCPVCSLWQWKPNCVPLGWVVRMSFEREKQRVVDVPPAWTDYRWGDSPVCLVCGVVLTSDINYPLSLRPKKEKSKCEIVSLHWRRRELEQSTIVWLSIEILMSGSSLWQGSLITSDMEVRPTGQSLAVARRQLEQGRHFASKQSPVPNHN